MSKLVFILAVVFTCMMAVTARAKVSYSAVHFLQQDQKPKVRFDSIWVNYTAWQGGMKGMLIHLKFTVYNMKDVDCEVAAYFEFDDEWPLMDKNKKFSSVAGDVAVFRPLKPGYIETVYNDLQLFMPNDELELTPGKYELVMDVDLYYGKGRGSNSHHLTFYDFVYTQPSTGVINTGKTPNIKLEKFWVDYDITENGMYGMSIRVKLVVANMKSTSSYLSTFFSYKDGAKLKSDSKGFHSEGGQLAIYKIIEPKYDESIYDDIRFFLPYSELRLPAGKHNLTLSLAFLDTDGNRIKTLKDYDFVFTKR
jgi:hypothetical protein